MENTRLDLRKIPRDELKKIKDEAIKMRDKGISNKEAAQRLNLDSSVLSRWYRKHIKNYRQPQENLKRGRREGTQKKIPDYQEIEIIKVLQRNNTLLDKKSCINSIQDEIGITIANSTISDYLKKWRINSIFVNDFKENFIKMLTKDKFDILEQKIKKLNGTVIWIDFSEEEIEFNTIDNLKLYSISTITLKNKLVFKLFRNQIRANDLIEFINQLSELFTKNLYVIYNTKNFKFVKEVNSFQFIDQIKIVEYETVQSFVSATDSS